MGAFNGFPEKGFRFLAGLKKNNSKAWFDAHRDEYEDNLLEPAKAFVVEMGERLAGIAPDVIAEPAINRSIKRMNRDIRFSNDKTPYKTHLDIIFPEGDIKTCSTSSFFLRMFGDEMFLGVGMHEFSKPSLDAYRDAVVGAESGPELRKAIGKVTKAGYPVGGKTYKRVPRGYDDSHANAEYLLHTSLYSGVTMPIPADAGSSKFVTFCFNHYKKMQPLHHWIRKAMASTS